MIPPPSLFLFDSPFLWFLHDRDASLLLNKSCISTINLKGFKRLYIR